MTASPPRGLPPPPVPHRPLRLVEPTGTAGVPLREYQPRTMASGDMHWRWPGAADCRLFAVTRDGRETNCLLRLGLYDGGDDAADRAEAATARVAELKRLRVVLRGPPPPLGRTAAALVRRIARAHHPYGWGFRTEVGGRTWRLFVVPVSSLQAVGGPHSEVGWYFHEVRADGDGLDIAVGAFRSAHDLLLRAVPYWLELAGTP